MNKELLLIPVGIIATCMAGILIFQNAVNSTNKQNASSNPFHSSQTEQISPRANGQEETVDKEAAFAIYTNGTFRIFSAPMYHTLSSEVFIEASNPNIIQIREAGITWQDFFDTLPFSLTNECLTTGTNETFCTTQTRTLKFFLNGERVEDILTSEIQDGDQLLVSFGPINDPAIPQQLKSIAVPYANDLP